MLKDAHFPQFLLVIYTHPLYSVLCTLYSLLWTLFLYLTLLSYALYFVLCFRLCSYTLHFLLILNISFQNRAIFWHFSFFSYRSPIWKPFRLLRTFRSGFPTERPVSWHRHEESTQNEDVVRTPGQGSLPPHACRARQRFASVFDAGWMHLRETFHRDDWNSSVHAFPLVFEFTGDGEEEKKNAQREGKVRDLTRYEACPRASGLLSRS